MATFHKTPDEPCVICSYFDEQTEQCCGLDISEIPTSQKPSVIVSVSRDDTECQNIIPKKEPAAIIVSMEQRHDVNSARNSSVDAAEKQESTEPPAPGTRSAKRMKVWQAVLEIIALNCSLGVLCLPYAFATLGLTIGIFCIVYIGLLLWYTGHLIWRFKMRHPGARTYPDMVEILWGRKASLASRPLLAVALTFIMASHLRAFGEFLQHVLDHKIGLGVAEFITLVPMLAGTFLWRSAADGMLISIVSCASILFAVLTGAIGIDRLPLPPHSAILIPSVATSTAAFPIALAIAQSAVMFAFMSHTAFPSIIDTMEQPSKFPKALKWSSIGTICFAIVVTVTFSCLAGPDVASPVLHGAKKPYQIASYAISYPALTIAPIVCCKVGALGIYDPLWAWCSERRVVRRRLKAWAHVLWHSLILILWGVAMTIANVLPKFDAIITLAGAMFAPILCIIFPAALQVHDGGGSWAAVYRRLKEQRRLIVGSGYLLLFLYGCAVLAFGLWGTSTFFTEESKVNETVPLPLADPLSTNGSVSVDALLRAFKGKA